MGHQAALNRERPDGGENIAAVLSIIDHGAIDVNLSKQVIDVSVWSRGAADNRHFAGQRIGAADAVNLSGVRRAHRRQQHRIALRGV